MIAGKGVNDVNLTVSIPSDRGIRSGNDFIIALKNSGLSQSPLIGAFVPGDFIMALTNSGLKVSIPSDRGIRSGTAERGC